MSKLLESFDKIIAFNTERYKGCRIERVNGQHFTLGKGFTSLQAAKDHIDSSYISIENSIKRSHA